MFNVCVSFSLFHVRKVFKCILEQILLRLFDFVIIIDLICFGI